MDRPLQYFSWKALPFFLKTDVTGYRVVSAFAFGCIVTLFFLFVKRSTNTSFGLAAVASVIFIPEYWLAIVYAQDVNKYTELFAILAYFVFFYYYQKKETTKRLVLYFLLILFSLRISILLKHIGRLFALILPLFLLFKNPQLIKQKKYIALIVASFLISFPVLGFLKRGFGAISMGSFTSGNGFLEIILNLFKSYSVILTIVGFFSVIALLVCIVMHLIIKIGKVGRNKNAETDKTSYDLVVFSLVWFILSVVLVYLARGFMYAPKDFQRYDTIYIICAFFIFLYSYIFYVTGLLKKEYKKVFRISILIFLMIGAIFNLYSLNQYRGGWGDYFITWRTTKKDIENKFSNSLLIIPSNNGFPFMRLSTDKNEYMMMDNLTDLSMIRQYSNNYSNVFVSSRYPLEFGDGTKMELYLQVKAKDNSWYASIKKLLRRGTNEIIHVYKYNNDDK